MAVGDVVRAWRPRIAGVTEVLHAAWRDHAYPARTHDTWTLLLVDDGRIGYELNGHGHAAVTSGVTLLPPHVVHDGRPATARGFRKRVVYLDRAQLAEDLIGAAVAAVAGAELDLVGIALHGPKNAVDKVLRGAHPHP